MHFASMSLGIFDFLIEWLTQFLMWIVGWVFDLINKLLAHLLYSVACSFLEIADVIQKVFKKLCGMDTYWVGNTQVEGIDPLLQMFTSTNVVQVLIALTLVAVVMVIVASIIQVIRTEFTTEGSKNSKGQIFGQALKSLLMFILVPVCCIGGVGLTNALLKTIDRATSLSADGSSIGASILVSAISGSNVIRTSGNAGGLSAADLQACGINVSPDSINQSNAEQYAQQIDNAFRNNEVLSNSWWGYQDITLIEKYYNIFDINFIILIGGSLLACYTLIMAAFGMIMRLFKGVVLFMISPPMVALMPLDGGSAFKQWRTAFLKQILAAYGTIVALNLLFLILPVVNNINLFGGQDFGGVDGAYANERVAYTFNGLMHMLFTLVGLFMLKDISSTVSNMIGADDAAASGEGMAKKVGGTVAKVGLAATGVGAAVIAKGRGAMLSKKSASLAEQLEKETNPVNRAALEEQLAQTEKKSQSNKKLASYGRKGVGVITGGMAKVAKDFTGGVVDLKTGESRFEARQKARKDEDEARKKRIESGLATARDKQIEEDLKDTNSAEFKKRNRGALGGYGESVRSQAAEKAQEYSANVAAAFKTQGNLSADAATIKNADITGKMINIGKALDSGDSLTASNELTAILNVLNSLTDKTEDQKDLIQKLTNLQQQVTASGGDASKLKALDNAAFKSLGEQAQNIAVTAETTAEVSQNFHINQNQSAGVNGELQKLGEQIASEVARKQGISEKDSSGKPNPEYTQLIERMKKEIINAQKAQLERMKEEKSKK